MSAQVQAQLPLPPFLNASTVLKAYTREQVKQHSKDGDLWTVIDSYVWVSFASFASLSKFVDMHPGGSNVLLDVTIAGGDSTSSFFELHRSEVLIKYKKLCIGQIVGEKASVRYPGGGELSTVPYAEPAWLTKIYTSPYYTPAHRALAVALRKYVDETVIPEARLHEESGKRPSQKLIKEMSAMGLLAMRLGPGKHLHGLILPGGMKGEDFDYFAELVVTQELARLGARGYQDGLSAGMWIGLTPILNYGTPAQKAKYIPEVLAGDKHICLAISEPGAGSDVAGITTRGVKSADGKFLVISGVKKWITNGMWSDYFTTAVRTSDKGMSMVLIPRGEGVETRAIKTSYSAAAGTSLVTFDNVKVPIENVIGEFDKGFAIVLSNFNHERLVMNHFTARQMRLVTEEAFKWANQRKVFGKPLIEQPVIRNKFARMFSRCEASQHWLEGITHQMCTMTYAQQAEHLAGPIALNKAYVTRCAQEVSDDAVQIFGGRGITKGGMGGLIELYQRSYKFDSILGGSEEILMDLGVKQAQRKMDKSVL